MKERLKSVLRRIKGKISSLKNNFINNRKEQTHIKEWFAQKMSFFNANNVENKSEGILLVQMVKDYEFTIKMAAASKLLAEQSNLEVNFYYVYVDAVQAESKHRKNNLALNRMHLSWGKKVLFNNSDLYKDQERVKSYVAIILKQIADNSIDVLLNFTIEGILIGDLIYDTYLRFYHKPTITGVDTALIQTIRSAINIFLGITDLIKTKQIKGLLNTYTSYIHHGISARICLANNIDVYTVGSPIYTIQKLEKNNPYHAIDHTKFSPDRILTMEQLQEAKEKFTSRFVGNIDSAVSYMRQTSYAQTKVDESIKALFALNKRNIVIYAHDFYDSPHVNRKLQFPDLYQFLKQTLYAIKDINDITVFVKTHPNGIDGCKEQVISLVEELNNPAFHILDESVSNLNIVELKPSLIVTARGTVAVEMAFFEIPVVALYDNSFVNFKFAHTCYDIATYFAIIKGEQKPIIDFDKEKIYSFYYQAFLEKMKDIQTPAFEILRSFKGDTYSDTYLEMVKNNETVIFAEEFLNSYKKPLNIS